MQDAVIRMKDGQIFCGPLWYWRPEEGWLSLAGGEDAGPEKIFLRDVEKAINKNQMIHAFHIADEDLLEKAKKQGWDGR